MCIYVYMYIYFIYIYEIKATEVITPHCNSVPSGDETVKGKGDLPF